MKSKTKMRAAVAALAAVALFLSGCAATGSGGGGSDKAQSKGSLAMSFAGLNIQIWNDMLPIMKSKVEAAGYRFLSDNPNWNADTQVSDWQSWIAQGDVKAIMGYPVQSDSLIPVTSQAAAAGIPVVGYGSNWNGVAASVALNHEKDGYALGKAVAKWIVDHGLDRGPAVDIALLGTDAVDLGRLRHKGFQEALNDAGIKANINQIADAIDVNHGYDAVQTQLNAFPKTKVWVALSNDPALGAYNALLATGVKPKDDSVLLANIDATDTELKIFRQDTFWKIMFAVPTRRIAEANAQMLIDAAEGKHVKNVILPTTRVTLDNAESFMLKNQK